jgi:hypothetical protein
MKYIFDFKRFQYWRAFEGFALKDFSCKREKKR